VIKIILNTLKNRKNGAPTALFFPVSDASVGQPTYESEYYDLGFVIRAVFLSAQESFLMLRHTRGTIVIIEIQNTTDTQFQKMVANLGMEKKYLPFTYGAKT
jgi:hypothetical protein